MLEKYNRPPDLEEVVILGKNSLGEVFRPSNWWERLCDMLALTGNDGRVMYSSYLFPKVIQDLPSVVVRLALEKDDPHAFELVKQFVAIHDLSLRAGRKRREMDSQSISLTLSLERRSESSFGW